MSFSDLQFVFRFIPVFFLVYYIAPERFRRGILFAGSLLFYAFFDLRFLALLAGIVLLNYAFAGRIALGKKRTFVTLVVLDAGLLALFKFLGQYVSARFLPVGISFYMFKLISFQADLYRRKITRFPSFLDAANYFILFPQIVSGPIMRYESYTRVRSWSTSALFSDAEHRARILAMIEEGLFYFAAGLGLKVLLADHLAMCWEQIAAIGYDSVSTPLAWIGTYCYSMNLYYDFWGYSLMAAGLGVMLGFPFIENFHHPYAAKNVADFYRRWHITLGSFFRDYLYIPLGGSREGNGKTVRNLLVVWLVTGLWHGVTLNFLVWGLSLCLLILSERFVLSRLGILGALLGRIHVLVLVPLTWTVFAISDPAKLGTYFARLFPFFGVQGNVFAGDYMKYLTMYGGFFAASLLLLFPSVFSLLAKYRRNPLIVLPVLALFWASVYSLAGSAGNPFMYLQF